MRYAARAIIALCALLLPVKGDLAAQEVAMVSPPQTIHKQRVMVPMPPAIVLIVCKTEITGEPDQNEKWTGHEGRDWATDHAMMTCRRQEVQMHDPAVDQGADPQPFTLATCQRSALLMGPNWDVQHRSSAYRFWRVACPVPIVRQNPDGSEDIIAWKLPDCGHRDTVVCEVDTAI